MVPLCFSEGVCQDLLKGQSTAEGVACSVPALHVRSPVGEDRHGPKHGGADSIDLSCPSVGSSQDARAVIDRQSTSGSCIQSSCESGNDLSSSAPLSGLSWVEFPGLHSANSQVPISCGSTLTPQSQSSRYHGVDHGFHTLLVSGISHGPPVRVGNSGLDLEDNGESSLLNSNPPKARWCSEFHSIRWHQVSTAGAPISLLEHSLGSRTSARVSSRALFARGGS
jgi:hypothetical protein